LRTMLSALERYLKEKGSKISIIKNREFISSRKILNGKAVDFYDKGLGKKRKRAEALTKAEEKVL